MLHFLQLDKAKKSPLVLCLCYFIIGTFKLKTLSYNVQYVGNSPESEVICRDFPAG